MNEDKILEMRFVVAEYFKDKVTTPYAQVQDLPFKDLEELFDLIREEEKDR